jgi:hypothetical protein
MNPYLAKLRATDETHHPQGPSKPSKPISSVVARGSTTAERGFEGFEGERGRCISKDEASINALEQTRFGCFGRTWAALAGRSPAHVPADRWQQAVEDGRRFLARWGAQAMPLGWTSNDLFALSPVPAHIKPSFQRLSRYDETGLIWLLQGRVVVGLTASMAAIQNPSGSITCYHKHNKPAIGPRLGSLGDHDE